MKKPTLTQILLIGILLVVVTLLSYLVERDHTQQQQIDASLHYNINADSMLNVIYRFALTNKGINDTQDSRIKNLEDTKADK